MTTSNFQNVAKMLIAEFEAKGYHCRLDTNHIHPRLYIGVNGTERFTILSMTANYNEGNLLHMKRQDIKRDVLSKLPTPQCPNGKTKTSEVLAEAKPEEPPPHRVFPVSVSIRGRGTLSINVPKEAIPDHAPLAQLQTFPTPKSGDVRIGLIFSPTHGKKASAVPRTTKLVCYHFARAKVSFPYAERQPKGWRAPTICARQIGDSLVCDTPIARELIQEPTKVSSLISEKTKSKAKYTIRDGTDLREMVNDWLAWARADGLEPKPSINDEGELCISIVRKVSADL